MIKQIAHAAVWSWRHLRGQLIPPELGACTALVAEGDTCLDIGAHAGAWLFPLGRLVGDKGKVVGVEALPYYARVLVMAKAVVGTRNVDIINFAVTEDGASVRIVWQDLAGARLTGRTHIAGRGESESAAIEIAGVTVDAICATTPGRLTFVKIDIEGAELGALRSGAATLRRFRPIVFSEVVEVHLQRYGHTAAMLFSFFDEMNYQPFSVQGGRLSPIALTRVSAVNDVLFVPVESIERLLAALRANELKEGT